MSKSHCYACTSFVLALAALPLTAQREWLDLLPQNAEVAQFRTVDLTPIVESVALPGEGPVRGIAHLNGVVWLARGDVLFGYDPVQAKVVRQRVLPEGLLGLSADAQFLYVLSKDAVQVFGATAEEKVRELALPAHEKRTLPTAIGCHGDSVYVAIGRRLVALDAKSGAARELPRWSTALQWLGSDGKVLWGGGTGDIRRVVITGAQDGEPQDGEHPPSLPMPVMRSSATFVGSRLLCAFDWVDGRGVMQHAAGYVRLDAREVPGECLSIKIYKDPSGMKYECGPKPLRNLALLKLELTRIAKDPSVMIPGPGGKRVMMPVTLEAYSGVLIEDLAAAWDVVTASGFSKVYCTQVDLERRDAEPPPPPPPPQKKKGR